MGKMLWAKTGREERIKGQKYYECQCTCGITKLVAAKHYGKNSFGCKKCCVRRANSTHSLRRHPLYRIYRGIIDRCYYPSCKSYKSYGAKGIKMIAEWREKPKTFIDWGIQSGYKKGLSIDRIDNTKGYSPDNCRWATPTQQAQNTKRNKNITYKGKTQCMSAWAREFSLNIGTLKSALYRGYTLEAYLIKRGII